MTIKEAYEPKVYTCKLCKFECVGRRTIRDHILNNHKKDWKSGKHPVWGNDPLSDYYREDGKDVPKWRKKIGRGKDEESKEGVKKDNI